jgi:hypothetical protein
MSTLPQSSRRTPWPLGLILGISLIGITVVAKNPVKDPLEIEMSTLESAVDNVLLEPGIRIRTILDRKDQRVAIQTKNGINPVYANLLKKIEAEKASLEKNLPGKPVALLEKLIGRYLRIENRLYLNYFANAHENHQRNSKYSADAYEHLNLKFPIKIGDQLMIGRETRFEHNLWHIESKSGSGVFDQVEIGPSPLEKILQEDAALQDHMTYENYALQIILGTQFQRETNYWSVTKLDPTFQNPHLDLSNCGYHTISHRASNRAHLGNYVDFLSKKDIYGDLTRSNDSKAVYSAIFSPVYQNPLLSPAEVGQLVKQYFFLQDSFKAKVGDEAPEARWITLWEKQVPASFNPTHQEYWDSNQDSAFKTANYPMDDWKDSAVATRLTEVAFESEKELLASVLLKNAENQSAFISEFAPKTDNIYWIAPEVSKARAQDLIAKAIAPIQERWKKQIHNGLLASLKSDIIKRVRAGRAEGRFERTYTNLTEDLKAGVRAQQLRDAAYLAYNTRKLDWEDQELLKKVNYSGKNVGVTGFLEDQIQKGIVLGKSRQARESFEKTSIDENLRLEIYHSRDDQLGLLPATWVGNNRMVPVDYLDLQALYEQKLGTYAGSETSSHLKDLALEIQKNPLVKESMDGFFGSVGTQYLHRLDETRKNAAKKNPKGVAQPLVITEANTPLYEIVTEQVKILFDQFQAKYPITGGLGYKEPAPQIALRVPAPAIAKPSDSAPPKNKANLPPPPDSQRNKWAPSALKGPSNLNGTAGLATKQPTRFEKIRARELLYQAISLLGLNTVINSRMPPLPKLGYFDSKLAISMLRNFGQRETLLTSKYNPKSVAERLAHSFLDQKILAQIAIDKITAKKPILSLSLNPNGFSMNRDFSDTTETALMGISRNAFSPNAGIIDPRAKLVLKKSIRIAAKRLPGQIREACVAHPVFNGSADSDGNVKGKNFIEEMGGIAQDFGSDSGAEAFKRIFNSSHALRRNLIAMNPEWKQYDDYWARETRSKSEKINEELLEPVTPYIMGALLVAAAIELGPLATSGFRGMILNGGGWSGFTSGLEAGAIAASQRQGISTLIARFATSGIAKVADTAFIAQFLMYHNIASINLPDQLKYELGLAHSEAGDEDTVSPIEVRDLKGFADRIHQAQNQEFISLLMNIPVGWSLYQIGRQALQRPAAKALERIVAFGGKDAEVLTERIINPAIRNSGTAAVDLVTKGGVKVFREGTTLADILELEAIAAARAIGIETLAPVLEGTVKSIDSEFLKVYNECADFVSYGNGVSESIKMNPYGMKLKDRLPRPPRLSQQIWAASKLNRKEWKLVMSEIEWDQVVSMSKESFESAIKYDPTRLATVAEDPEFYRKIATLVLIKRKYLMRLAEQKEFLVSMLDDLARLREEGVNLAPNELSREFYSNLFKANPQNLDRFYKAFKTGIDETIQQPWYTKRLSRRLSRKTFQFHEIEKLGKDFHTLRSQLPAETAEAAAGATHAAGDAEEETWVNLDETGDIRFRRAKEAKPGDAGQACHINITPDDIE